MTTTTTSSTGRRSDDRATWDESYVQDRSIWSELPFNAAIADLATTRDGPVLEIPCGGGRNTVALSRRTPHLVGVDRSDAALAVARRALDVAHAEKVLLVRGDVHALPFPEQTFDGVYCADLLGHLRDPRAALEELVRVTRTGGRVFATFFGEEDSTRRDPGAEPISSNEVVFRDVYFRYDSRDAVTRLVRLPRTRVVWIDEARWDEPPHPGYRDYPHSHHSHLVLLERIS
ncbi:MAG TPA: class I SAM-dependent methyltransferase [Solirubrobacteraceae bacterium]|jgi:ubiquinone/menaquinone biosynthesis C-methylase UbiE